MTDGKKVKKILVIDDEQPILKMLESVMHFVGYQTFCTISAEDGLKIFTEHRDQIGLILLDILMPKMNGIEAFYRFREIDPTVPIIIISGYTNDSEIMNFIIQNKLKFFRKPFHIEELMDAIREILSSQQE